MATPVPTHPQETLRRAQRVELVALRQVNDAMVGAYLSRFKGRGTDFEELREYVPGDDVRAMDWNVTARTGKPFVRLHREERELTLVLGVHLGEDHVRVGLAGRLEDRGERTARAAPGSPVINQNRRGGFNHVRIKATIAHVFNVFAHYFLCNCRVPLLSETSVSGLKHNINILI